MIHEETVRMARVVGPEGEELWLDEVPKNTQPHEVVVYNDPGFGKIRIVVKGNIKGALRPVDVETRNITTDNVQVEIFERKVTVTTEDIPIGENN